MPKSTQWLLTFVLLWTIGVIAQHSLLVAQEPDDRLERALRNPKPPTFISPQSAQRTPFDPRLNDRVAEIGSPKAPIDQRRDMIALTVWVLTIGDAPETPDDEMSVDFTDRVRNLPDKFASVEEVRALVGQLKVAGMLRRARELRLITVDGQPVHAQTGNNRPRIVATSYSPQRRDRLTPPRPDLDAQFPSRVDVAPANEPRGQSDSIITNSVTYEQIGTTTRLLARIDSNGSIQVQFSYDASDTEESRDVNLMEMPGRKPLTADKVVTREIASTVRLKSGTAVVAQIDSSQEHGGESHVSASQIVILAATAVPAIE